MEEEERHSSPQTESNWEDFIPRLHVMPLVLGILPTLAVPPLLTDSRRSFKKIADTNDLQRLQKAQQLQK